MYATSQPQMKTFLFVCLFKLTSFVSYLSNILSLGDPFISYFDSWVTETFDQVSRVQPHQVRCFVSI